MPKVSKRDGGDERNILDILLNFVNSKVREMDYLRRENADLSTNRKRLELQINSLRKRIEQTENHEKVALAAGRSDLAAEAKERVASDREMLQRWEKHYADVSEAEEDSYRTSQLLHRANEALNFSIQAFRTNGALNLSRQEIRQRTAGRADIPIETAAKLAMINELLPEGVRHKSSYSAISIFLREGGAP